METILKLLAQHWHLTASQYWQLRLLFAISLVPLLGVLYIVLIDKRTRLLHKLRSMGLPGAHPTRLFSSGYTAKPGVTKG
jgi:hypothetical protein